MKKVLFITAISALCLTIVSCQGSPPNPVEEAVVQAEMTSISTYDQIAAEVEAVVISGGDGQEQGRIFSEEEFSAICKLEDEVLNVWSDEDLRSVMPVGDINSRFTYEEKLQFLRSKLHTNNRTASEGATVETYCIRSTPSGTKMYFDATPDVVAQVIAASGQIVGVKSSLNMWRPTYPFDNGQVTAFDVTRALSGVSQVSFLDTFIEYDPSTVVFETEVSGGNWLISVDIISYNTVGTATVTSYGSNTPNGPLIWNPTLNSPGSDDLIEGPMPNGYYSISANGLTPDPSSSI